jgi:mevalonate kinase
MSGRNCLNSRNLLIPPNPRRIGQTFRANGKLLLTGEYFVMDGAIALALPTTFGQSLRVSEASGSEIVWKSYDSKGQQWFSASLDLLDFKAIKTSDPAISDPLTAILKAASKLNSDFLSHWKKYKVDTFLEFDRAWGMGSSSTLISCIAQWADVNPYHLLFDTLGGSGCDVACARAEGPILYRLGDTELHIDYIDFDPPYLSRLFLVYLGKKQDTKAARDQYYQNRSRLNGTIEHISKISTGIPECRSLTDFERALEEHEEIVSKCLHLPKAKAQYFSDYWGAVKSLGAWGGDFVLATSEADETATRAYFERKGYSTIFRLSEIMRTEAHAEAGL